MRVVLTPSLSCYIEIEVIEQLILSGTQSYTKTKLQNVCGLVHVECNKLHDFTPSSALFYEFM